MYNGKARKRAATRDELIRLHERYIEGLIDGSVAGHDDFQAYDIRSLLMDCMVSMVADVLAIVRWRASHTEGE